MPEVALYNQQGEQIGEIELFDAVFAVPVNEAVMHQAVVAYLANRRVATAKVKIRSEVRGGGRKPWRQKGTGRARHGSIRSPIWRGGGVVFGPTGRQNFKQSLPKKMKRLALKSALSSKVNSGSLLVLDALQMDVPKTKEMIKLLEKLQTGRKVLLVLESPQVNVIKSARNIPGVKTTQAEQLNVYDILNTDHLIMTRDAVSRVEEVFA
ncbi:MAG: 50S ribosomal protein L4 [Bacillota bacterium]|jgi:large subunit ribosomal protein L4|nr:50S ribosomal protein L4 [Bacillota bacterium]HHU30362.1 50S ribosomal protein L4 [Bacillota bacterium]